MSWAAGALREALLRSALLDERSYEIFGQGSRVTNTYDHSSDVDLVLMLNMPVKSGVDTFDEVGTDFMARNSPGLGGWEGFRGDVLAALGETYVVRMGRRCVNVDDPHSIFGEMVDILIATEYRVYTASPSPGIKSYQQGVFFRDSEGWPIVNFPKQHRRNGVEKDRRTGGQFKNVVRAAKRVRRRAEQERMIAEGAAPSYLLECLLYNVPNHIYRKSSLVEAVRGALGWLRWCCYEDPVRFAGLPCQNGINQLFGAGPDQWRAGEAARIVEVLHEL